MTYEAVAFILILYVLPAIALMLEVYYAPHDLEEVRVRGSRHGR
jgi:hypothetical protein